MADQRYPVFEGGQTLTKDDLNLLRGFLDGSDQLLGRLIGFGIACGLRGEVKGGNLVIDGGLAIDQAGHPLRFDGPLTVPTGIAPNAEFPFIEAGPNGVTPVLVFDEQDEPAPECDDAGCEAHAATRVRRATIVFAKGRLKTAEAAFGVEPLLQLNPLTVTTNSAVQGAFVGIKTAIQNRLTAAGVTLSAAGQAALNKLSIDAVNDLPALKIYKAAFLNQVLFATIELMRCRSLHGAICLRTEAKPGVALGWLNVAGGVAVWECEYRHNFQPPAGLSMALLGGGCDDPCDLFLDRLEALLASYGEPAVPKPEDPPKDPPEPGDFHICPKWKAPGSKYGGKVSWRDCIDVYVPPKQVPPKWTDIFDWVKDQPFPFDPGYVDPVPPWVVYDEDPPDFLGAGAVSLLPTWGTRATDTKTVLENVIKGHDLTPDVRVLTAPEAAKLTNYTPQATVSLGDTMVLVKDDLGKVITTGRIANQQVLKTAGPALNQAVDVSTRAGADATAAKNLADTLNADYGGFKEEMNAFKDGLGDLGGLREEVERLPEFREDITRLKEERAVEIHRLELDIGAAMAEARSATVRINDLVRTPTTAPPIAGADVNSDLLKFFTSARDAVEKAATGRQRPAVLEALAGTDEAMTRLREGAGASTPLATAEPEALLKVMDGLVEAAKRAGAPQESIANLVRDAEAVRNRVVIR